VTGLDDYEIKELIRNQFGQLGHQNPYGCDTEVALADRSTPLRFDIAVPPEKLGDIVFCPRNGAPLGLKHIKDGKLASSISLQGNVRRLCSSSTTLFAELVALSEAAEIEPYKLITG
jgi:hypothetical protein